MKKAVILVCWLAIGCAFPGCQATGGTETGTTNAGDDLDTSSLDSRLSSAAGALVPNLTTTGLQGLVESGDEEVQASEESELEALTVGTDTDWSSYLDSNNNYVLTDIFGSATEEPRVVTKIRVLLDQFKSTLGTIFSADPKLTCKGATVLAQQGDTITIPFYGAVANGPSTNRFFDCVVVGSGAQSESDSSRTTLYGRDADSVIRVVTMSDNTSTNTEQAATRGDKKVIRVVVSATYAEKTESGSKVVYLDLQFSHGSSYNGVDGTFGTSDDVIFKSRSRITGRVVLDSSGTPTLGAGDFTVTKYDSSGGNTTVTRALGRGSYGTSKYSLLKIKSDVSALKNIANTFCIQMPSSSTGKPSNAAETNCTDLETGYAWGSVSFPFTPSPALPQVFTERAYFEGNDTDMVSNTGDNFTIPSYK